MRYPILEEQPTSRDLIDVFGGYNHNLRIGDGEFYDMTNLSSTHYPVLSPRSKRGTYAKTEKTYGMVAKDAFCYVDDGYFVMNEKRIHMGLTVDKDNDGNIIPKTLISMGAYVIIMPDKKYINTANIADNGKIEASFVSSSENRVTYSLCKLDGEDYDNVVAQNTAPSDPENMDLWIDTSSVPHTLKQYSTTTSMWSAIATTYIKISSPGIGIPFSVNDGVTISGVDHPDLSDLNASMVIWAKGDDYIVVQGILDAVYAQTSPVTVERKMPNMDFIIESENRLWGCRYGTALNGDVVNEIYACKLGDFKNWNCFMGISTDSYAASVGTDGQFTGAITHLGYPLFFKETCLHKIYGNYPANYQIQTTTCRGVQKGCSRSLAIVNEVLYYKSRSAICAYDGSLPEEISSSLGDNYYSNASAGTLGNKYYVSMADTDNIYHLFVFDTKRGLWHREDNTQAIDFCSCRGDLYYLESDGTIKTVLGSGEVDTTNIKWMAETGVLGTSSPDSKYISRIVVRMSLDIGTRVRFYIQYDSSESWDYLFTMTGKTLRSFSVPIKPQRCDHLRLRIEGEGDAKIYSISKTIEQGSDL